MLRATIAAATILAGCASDHLTDRRQDPPLDPLCTIGRSEPCACPDGAQGAQECVEPGVYVDCRCEGYVRPDAATPDGQGGQDAATDGGRDDPRPDSAPWQSDEPDAGEPDADHDAGEGSLFWAFCQGPGTLCAPDTEPDLRCQDFYRAGVGLDRDEAVRCSFSCECSTHGCGNERCAALGGECVLLAPNLFPTYCAIPAE